VDEISGRTGLGEAFAVMVLLGGVASLPGVAVLALADALIGRDALTSVVVRRRCCCKASFNALPLTFVAMAVTAGDVAVGPVGLWSAFLLTACLLSVRALSGYERRVTWTSETPEDAGPGRAADGAAGRAGAAGTATRASGRSPGWSRALRFAPLRHAAAHGRRPTLARAAGARRLSSGLLHGFDAKLTHSPGTGAPP
jgi:hypothetical protein